MWPDSADNRAVWCAKISKPRSIWHYHETCYRLVSGWFRDRAVSSDSAHCTSASKYEMSKNDTRKFRMPVTQRCDYDAQRRYQFWKIVLGTSTWKKKEGETNYRTYTEYFMWVWRLRYGRRSRTAVRAFGVRCAFRYWRGRGWVVSRNCSVHAKWHLPGNKPLPDRRVNNVRRFYRARLAIFSEGDVPQNVVRSTCVHVNVKKHSDVGCWRVSTASKHGYTATWRLRWYEGCGQR